MPPSYPRRRPDPITDAEAAVYATDPLSFVPPTTGDDPDPADYSRDAVEAGLERVVVATGAAVLA
jgi:hypothetical protein